MGRAQTHLVDLGLEQLGPAACVVLYDPAVELVGHLDQTRAVSRWFDPDQSGVSAQRAGEMLGQPAVFGPVGEQMDHENPGTFDRLCPVGVRSNQPDQPAGLPLGQHER